MREIEMRLMEIERKLKMRELGIFKNMTPLKEKVMLHQDDMPSYNSWFLIEHHNIDKIVYRGDSSNLTFDVISGYNISQDLFRESLKKIGNPKNILITYSTQDTY